MRFFLHHFRLLAIYMHFLKNYSTKKVKKEIVYLYESFVTKFSLESFKKTRKFIHNLTDLQCKFTMRDVH